MRARVSLVRMQRIAAVAGTVLSCLAGCERGPAPSSDAETRQSSSASRDTVIDAELATLRREEGALRSRTDFATLPPSSRSLGANPYALVAAGPGAQAAFVGLLRGDARVVLLDDTLRELSGTDTPPSPNALAVAGDRVFVVSPLARRILRYRLAGAALSPEPAVELPEARALEALVADGRSIVAADFARDVLFGFATEPPAPRVRELSTCRGPFRLALSARALAVSCLFDHAVVVYSRDERGEVGPELGRVVHDGPLWSLALLELNGSLWLGTAGVEDRPLERRDKVFGYIDSFAFLYRFETSAARPTRVAELNTSELGVVTPKAIELRADGDELVLSAFGYGSDRRLELTLPAASAAPRVVSRPALPGCAAVARSGKLRACANPLLDAWVSFEPALAVQRARLRRDSEPSPEQRLGEALFFTTLMAPDASSDGRLSRFTCETCHFEGGSDGRVHHSGRGEIRVSTRPLFGLFNAAPHFSRAHDPDLTSVSHNEFAVANRGNPHDPWFALDVSRFPWLAELELGGDAISPLDLRRALLAFLARFSHEENPYAFARHEPRRFSGAERGGARLFRERCASCHAARLVANDPATEVPFERWEALVLSPAGALVWSRGDYAETGVLPYVEKRGTRIPSLRRLYEKRPYFTNGGAPTLDALLASARFGSGGFSHQSGADGSALAPHERAELLAFLQLL